MDGRLEVEADEWSTIQSKRQKKLAITKHLIKLDFESYIRLNQLNQAPNPSQK